MATASPQIVWFKRDLRLTDHAPLAAAAANGPVICLYVVEPDFWRQPDASGRHYAFITECLASLKEALAGVGASLTIRTGNVVDVLKQLVAETGAATVWSHEETGNGWTYRRDLAVQAWARGAGLAWHELPQTGVIRRIKTRAGWAKAWDRRMAGAIIPTPESLPTLQGLQTSQTLPSAAGLGLADDPCPGRQTGGREAGLAWLESFLTCRGRSYRTSMSSPISGADACMRSLIATGWLNFRMRAMLMAVASYHLWLPWQETGLVLARLFTDYEPGIHWPQVQMQSGVTGINTVRIYNPIKQGNDQDPDGRFVRLWFPELAEVPDEYIHEPWKWQGASRLSYPAPITDHLAAARSARDAVWGLRKSGEFKAQADVILSRHGSRKSGVRGINLRRKAPAKQMASNPAQPDLFADF